MHVDPNRIKSGYESISVTLPLPRGSRALAFATHVVLSVEMAYDTCGKRYDLVSATEDDGLHGRAGSRCICNRILVRRAKRHLRSTMRCIFKGLVKDLCAESGPVWELFLEACGHERGVEL
jgi:hypothetical protein